RAVGAFPAADTACTAAALGGQREALTTLPIPRCPAATEPEDEPVPLRCTNRRAVGAFPAADTACTAAALGGQRGALTTLPIPRCPAATEPEDGQLRCTNRRAGPAQQPGKFHQPRKSPPDGGLVRREIAY